MRRIVYLLVFCAGLVISSVVFVGHHSKSQAAQGSEPVYDPKEVDTKAVILSRPKAEYTNEARQNNFSGAVLLEVVLSSSGTIEDIKVVSPLPYGLTDRALKAVRKIKFEPAIKDGSPVSQRTKVEYHFNIYERVYFGDRSKMIYYEQGCYNYSNIALSDKIYFKSSKEAKKAGYSKAKERCPGK